MTRTQGALAVSALVLAGCASVVSGNSGASGPAKQLGSVTQTLHIQAAPIAGTGVRIAPAPAQTQPAGSATERLIPASGVTHPVPAASAPATSEQPSPPVAKASCPANPHSGLPCAAP